MTVWRDKNGPVFRLSPDSAWPLGQCDRDRRGEAGETPKSDSTEGDSAGLKGIARLPKRHLKAVK
jgi:hypothetical protein